MLDMTFASLRRLCERFFMDKWKLRDTFFAYEVMREWDEGKHVTIFRMRIERNIETGEEITKRGALVDERWVWNDDIDSDGFVTVRGKVVVPMEYAQ